MSSHEVARFSGQSAHECMKPLGAINCATRRSRRAPLHHVGRLAAERDREIDNIGAMVRAAGKAGIPALKYNLTILGVVRTGAVVLSRAIGAGLPFAGGKLGVPPRGPETD
jgi:hypothetical protein